MSLRGIRTTLLLATVASVAQAAGELTDEQRATLAGYFGFGEMQIYKYKSGIGELQLADLSHNGRIDIALWNRWENRIEMLSSADDDAPPATAAEPTRNEPSDRGSLRRQSLSVANRIDALAVGDLNGDGINDLVYFGEPRELVILPGNGDGTFGERIARRVQRAEAQSGGLALGDFNHDGRTDVALKGEQQILIFLQQPDGTLGAPERVLHDAAQSALLLTADVDGDGRDDLILGVDDEEAGLLIFRQTDKGLGPVERVKMPPVRSITVARRADGPDDVFTIERATNRLVMRRWGQRETGDPWTPVYHSFPFTSRATQRALAVGDLDGDGIDDAVAADPDSGSLVFYRGSEDGFEPGVLFPTLLNVREMQVVDLDGQGTPELLCLSVAEKQLAASRFVDGRLTFPQPIPLGGEPQAFHVGRTRPDGPQIIAVFLKSPNRVLLLNQHGEQLDTIEIGDLSDDVGGLRFIDINRNGREDLLLFVKFASPVVLLQNDSGGFERADIGGAAPSRADIEAFATADVTGDGTDEALLVQRNLARALRIEDGRWVVVDQYNPDTSDAALRGLAWLPGERTGLAAYDETQGDLLFWTRRDDAAFEVSQRIRVGRFQSPSLTRVTRAGRPALLLADAQRMALITQAEQSETLIEQTSYETALEEAWMADSVIGDFNGDGIRDVALIDVRRARIEILTTLPTGDLVRATHFQVFQGKSFSASPDARGEPRQVLAADVTGNGRDDLVMIVHDRVLIYPGQ